MSLPIMELWVALLALIAAAGMTRSLMTYGARHLLDQPNARSSHIRPVPRGGGLAIVLCFLGSLVALRTSAQNPLYTALLIGGGIVAAVGYWDDHKPVRARWRLLAHLGAATFAVALIGPLQHLPFGSTSFELPIWLSFPLSVFGLAWLLNLYNFMDGIDGLAGMEAVSVVLIAACLAALHAIATPGLIALAAAAAGFLVWNRPPARIFMGDVGSGFLGFVLGVYALHSTHNAPHWFWVWVILLGVFWVDATLTLLRRLAHRQPVYAAHRTHAYQNLARRLKAHRPVTLGALALNVFYLAPLAACAAQFPQWSAATALTAVVPLAVLAYLCRAGEPEHLQPASRVTEPVTETPSS